MKKIKFMALMLACITALMMFTACGDDDDDPDSNNTPTDIIGSWSGTYGEDDGWATAEFREDGTVSIKYKKDGAAWSRNWFRGNYTVNKKNYPLHWDIRLGRWRQL